MAKKFQFRLEVVLTERKRQEEKRLQEWTLARQVIGEMIKVCEALKARLRLAMTEATDLAGLKHNVAANLISMEHFITGTKTKIGWKEREIERAEKLVERKRLEYVAASQKRKTLEKLKESKLKEYMLIQKKKENKALDDIYVMRGMRFSVEEEAGEMVE